MLLGDAAGMVSPLTAGGIHRAYLYGRLGGQALANYLRQGGTAPGRGDPQELSADAPGNMRRGGPTTTCLPEPCWKPRCACRSCSGGWRVRSFSTA